MWIIFVLQVLAAAVGIAGLCGVVGSAMGAFLPGDNRIWAVAMLLLSTLFTTSGQYGAVETVSRYMALALMLMAIVSALILFPAPQEVVKGLSLNWPENSNLYVILPWIGTIVAGSMGIIWFGYWTATRGYGGGLISEGPEQETEIP